MISIINKISSLPYDFNMLAARKKNLNDSDGHKDVNVNTKNMLICLTWLKANTSR